MPGCRRLKSDRRGISQRQRAAALRAVDQVEGGVFQRQQGRLDALKIQPAGMRQGKAPAVPGQQPDADKAFQPGYLPADGTGRDTQLVGRLGNRQMA